MLFAETRVSVSQIVSAITECFPFYATSTDQTVFLRRALDELGTSLGYKVIGARSNRPAGECLGLTWWEPGKGTILAADCEWGNAGEVSAAFTNLLTIKATVKLLVFRSRDAGTDREDILLRTDIDANLKAVGAALVDFEQHLQGEHYVLVERVDQQSLFRTYEFVSPTDGKLGLEFEQAVHAWSTPTL